MAKLSYRRARKQWVADLRDLGGGRVHLPKGTTKPDADARFADLVKEAGATASGCRPWCPAT